MKLQCIYLVCTYQRALLRKNFKSIKPRLYGFMDLKKKDFENCHKYLHTLQTQRTCRGHEGCYGKQQSQNFWALPHHCRPSSSSKPFGFRFQESLQTLQVGFPIQYIAIAYVMDCTTSIIYICIRVEDEEERNTCKRK